jgi:hypothetical protein
MAPADNANGKMSSVAHIAAKNALCLIRLDLNLILPPPYKFCVWLHSLLIDVEEKDLVSALDRPHLGLAFEPERVYVADLDRHALNPFHKIPRHILGRQQAETLGHRPGMLFTCPLESTAPERIDRDYCALARADASELSLIGIGCYLEIFNRGNRRFRVLCVVSRIWKSK